VSTNGSLSAQAAPAIASEQTSASESGRGADLDMPGMNPQTRKSVHPIAPVSA
jgi:hypothetical protein